ncbi:hypothetical protein B1168_00880, partial [Enterococcus faecium]
NASFSLHFVTNCNSRCSKTRFSALSQIHTKMWKGTFKKILYLFYQKILYLFYQKILFMMVTE